MPNPLYDPTLRADLDSAFRVNSSQTNAVSGRTLSTYTPDDTKDGLVGKWSGLVYTAPWHNSGTGNVHSGTAFVAAPGFPALLALDKADGTKDGNINLEAPNTAGWLDTIDGLTQDAYIGHYSPVMVADFNGDSYQDFFVPNGVSTAYGTDNTWAYIRTGFNGDGTNGPPTGSDTVANGAKLVSPEALAHVTYYAAGDVLAAGSTVLVAGTADRGVNVIDFHGHDLSGTTPTYIHDAGFHMGLTGSVRVAAGDINGDGRDDIVASSGSGATGDKVFFVTDTTVLDAADGTVDENGSVDHITPASGAVLTGFGTFNINSMPVATGDMDGDGKSDVAVTSFSENSGYGIVRIVFGTTLANGGTIDTSTLNGTNGFAIKGLSTGGANPAFGRTITFGDVNNDGFGDILIGAPGMNQARGALFVVFGKAGGFGSEFDLATLDGNNGFRIDPADIVGGQLGAAAVVGDFTGDGLNDIAVSADQTSTGAQYGGTTYIFKGVLPNGPVNRTGTDIANAITGGNSNDNLDLLGGADRAMGWGGSDHMDGGEGKDTLLGGNGKDYLTGSLGRDWLGGGDGGKGEQSDGADFFIFKTILDSAKTYKKADVLLDFRPSQDRIDVHLIDAKPGGVDNHFDFIGSAAFTKAGQIRVVAHGSDTEIQFNAIGKTGTDMMIVLDNIKPSAVHEGDFIL